MGSSLSTRATIAPIASSTATAPIPTPSPALPGATEPAAVTSPGQAAALVFASNPTFGSITPAAPGAVGNATSYTATQSGTDFKVTISMGSGDCLSGCISQHTWNYSVSGDGAITLTSESGDPAEGAVDHGTSDPATVTLRLVAGPVCPVEQNPPSSMCAARPVTDAEVIMRDPMGDVAASGTSDASGQVTLSVPGGAYYAEPTAATGVMRAAQPTAFSVPGGRSVTITLEYDTGIR